MIDPLFVPLGLFLMAYYAWHWAALTSEMIEDARQQRLKRHLDWTVARRRLSAKGGWRFW